MNDADAGRRTHWVSHITRHAQAKPGAVYLRFESASTTWAQLHERGQRGGGGPAAARRQGRGPCILTGTGIDACKQASIPGHASIHWSHHGAVLQAIQDLL